MRGAYYLEPLGCAKNQVDAETMMGFLGEAGWVSVTDPREADIIIINSCGFIESAKQESINTVLGYRKTYPNTKILLSGCLAQGYAQELATALPEADLIFGNQDLSRITYVAERALAQRPGDPNRVYLPLETGEADALPLGKRPLLSAPGSAYVKIAEGCDNHCAFCSIPRLRGPLRSRVPERVVDECRELLDRGITELCLIGQDLASYGTDRTGGESLLPQLLKALSHLEGRFWVRLLYLHPDKFPLPLLELIRDDQRLLPYFDLPFQHGAVRILRAMNRRGTGESYLALVRQIRFVLPEATIRSTFLTGFPGETERDFEELLAFQEEAQLDWVGCFTYSPEPYTSAVALKPQVPRRIAVARKRRVEMRQVPITCARLDRLLGTDVEALVEASVPGQGASAEYLARIPCQAPEVDGLTRIKTSQGLSLGALMRGRVIARRGFDLELGLDPDA
ncbi:MAG: 30S ribosomal protein S12 methylthiotransferase RimO [Spirochaetaceae bacterium]|jgi:ribosomal protein S12 methylthiotransferase|nr:30S ribosomal protein S12 methylthiotransferase RimO [Spirochaetaceae bacterium]